MPAPKEKVITEGRNFLSQVLAKVPAESRAAVQTALEADGVLEEIGRGALARADYSRNMNQVQADHNRLETWYREKLPLLEAGQKALARGRTTTPVVDDDDDDLEPDAATRRRAAPAVDTSRFIDRDTATQALQAMEANSITFASMLSRISLNHFKEFGEVLDPDALIQLAEEKRLRIDLAYDQSVADRRAKRVADEHEAALKKAREEGEAAGRQAALTGADLPTISGTPAITTMDGLRTGDNKPEVGLSAALRTYHEESAKAGAASR